MTDYAQCEFEALRATIRSRGQARVALFLVGIALWAFALIAILALVPNPIAAVIPLLLLVASFEGVRNLHLGVERIGRYLQVFFEEPMDAVATAPPAWERTAMAFGPAMPGAGGHPLFLPVFLLATVVNMSAVLLPGPLLIEINTLVIPHLAFLIWMIYCDRGMRKQRATELARFRALQKDSPLRGPQGGQGDQGDFNGGIRGKTRSTRNGG